MKSPIQVLRESRALWNRRDLDLESDEVLAQIVDRGSIDDWRALYTLMSGPGSEAKRLRCRVLEVLRRAPTGFPHFWLAALSSLGVDVDWTMRLPPEDGEAQL